MNETDFNDWLESLVRDVSPSDTISQETIEETSEESSEAEVTTTNLSMDDFTDILADNGFEEPIHNGDDDEGVIEEEEENTEEEYNENIGERRDLDAEEDAEGEARVDSGEIRESDMATATDSSYANLARRGRQQIAQQQETTQSEEPLIPENSPTLLRDESTARFSGTEWYNGIKKAEVIIAGIGGIGSNVAFQLARMTPATILLYDPDRVETVNMSGQLYATDDVGKYKVDAIASMIEKYTSAQSVYAIRERFTESSEAGDIMICGFDNMTARKEFFRSWIAHIENKTSEEKKKCLFLDGRLSIDTLQVFCITGDDEFNQRRYMNDYLFSDREADETICSMKQTTYLACMIGSVIVNLFTNFIAGTLDPIIPYDLPFFTQYEAQYMLFKTEN